MPTVEVFTSSDMPAPLVGRVRTLLDDTFEEFSGDDWEHALGGWHAIVSGDNGDLVAHAAVVPRLIDVGARTLRCGYVEAVATAPAVRGSGHGSRALGELMPTIRREFELGALSTGTHGFYERLGWERWRGPTFVVRAGARVRTPDEDDAAMVYRFGARAHLPLTDPIAVRERRGDDW